jgi:acyl-CoA thioesterase
MMREILIEKMSNDPFAKSLGITIDTIAEGYAKVTMEVAPTMVNFHGAMHGGAIFTLADTAFALASNSYGNVAVGVNVTMNFIKAGKNGDKLTALVSEVSKNHKLGFYHMTVKNEADELIATAEGMVYRKKEQFV